MDCTTSCTSLNLVNISSRSSFRVLGRLCLSQLCFFVFLLVTLLQLRHACREQLDLLTSGHTMSAHSSSPCTMQRQVSSKRQQTLSR